jgi:hypothetical protein
VLLNGNAESLGHEFKLLVKFFGLHTLFHTTLLWKWLPAFVAKSTSAEWAPVTISSRQDAAPIKKVNIIDFDCVVLPGLNAVMNGLDYNLSRLFNQDMLAASL